MLWFLLLHCDLNAGLPLVLMLLTCVLASTLNVLCALKNSPPEHTAIDSSSEAITRW